LRKELTNEHNLNGKECGKGICQRKAGLYSARYVEEPGKRHDKYSPPGNPELPEVDGGSTSSLE